ncbi:MAG TPA: hypothetical protein VG826_32010 [Pirellulales bacterium]|nr:hypothetical protein [Pirellulales bacterium]
MAAVAPQAKRSTLALVLAASASAAFGLAFHQRWFPLGVPGELEVPRLGTWDVPIASWVAMLPAVALAGAMVAFVVWCLRWIENAPRRSFLLSLVACIAFGGAFQLFLEIAAPGGLQKWAVLHHGFRAAARLKFDDVSSVFKNHARVAEELEPNHVSANPAGWVTVYRALLSFFDAHPDLARAVWNVEPDEIAWAMRQNFATPLPDQAAIAVVAFASRLLGVLVGLPVAWLVRQRFGRQAALAACAMASLVPASSLLAPAVDTVYPTIAALIVALSWYASQRRSAWPAAAAGALVGVGMFFSLCFLVVAGLCALMVAFRALTGHRPTSASVAAAGSAWLAVVGLFAVMVGHRLWESWSVNLAKNREFNANCGCSYGLWIGVNLLELAVAMGIPATVFLLARVVPLPLPSGEGRGEGASASERVPGVDRLPLKNDGIVPPDPNHPHPNPLPEGEGKKNDRPRPKRDATLMVAWLSIVVLLDLSGTNRGEVSRLWLFLMPLGAALAVEWLDMADRRGRAVVGALLLVEALNCVLLARELMLLWPSAPRQIQQQYLASPGGKWASYRRLSDQEIERRRKSEAAR